MCRRGTSDLVQRPSGTSCTRHDVMHAVHHDVSIARLGGKLLSSGMAMAMASTPPHPLPPSLHNNNDGNLPPYSYPFFVLMVIVVTTPACLATILAR